MALVNDAAGTVQSANDPRAKTVPILFLPVNMMLPIGNIHDDRGGLNQSIIFLHTDRTEVDKLFPIRYELVRMCVTTPLEERMILDFEGKRPRVDPTAFIAENSLIIGDVELGEAANVWFFCLLRGDVNSIRVGAGCNIQDGCILHVGSDHFPLVMDADVVLGHRVTAHGCHIARGALIGIGATILNGARIGEEAIVGAGSVVTPGTVVPPRTLALGTPAKPVRDLTERDFAMMKRTRANYRRLMQMYKK